MSSRWIVFVSVLSTIPWYQTQRSCCRTSSNTSGPLGTSDLSATTIYITKKKKAKYLFGGGVAVLAGLLDYILVDLVGLVVRCVVLICHL